MEGSYGFKGYTGEKGSGGRWEDYWSPFGRSGGTSVIGCGVLFDDDGGSGACFFTLHGRFAGVAFRGVERGLHPTVTFNDCTVEANFGQKPFKYDLDWQEVKQLCNGDGDSE